MNQTVRNPYYAKKLAESDYDRFMTIVRDVADEYDVSDADLFGAALKEWWEGNDLDVVMRANLIMDDDAFYEVARRCKGVRESDA